MAHLVFYMLEMGAMSGLDLPFQSLQVPCKRATISHVQTAANALLSLASPMSCFRLLLQFEADEAPNHQPDATPSPSHDFGSLFVGHDEPLLDTNSRLCEARFIGATLAAP